MGPESCSNCLDPCSVRDLEMLPQVLEGSVARGEPLNSRLELRWKDGRLASVVVNPISRVLFSLKEGRDFATPSPRSRTRGSGGSLIGAQGSGSVHVSGRSLKGRFWDTVSDGSEIEQYTPLIFTEMASMCSLEEQTSGGIKIRNSELPLLCLGGLKDVARGEAEQGLVEIRIKGRSKSGGESGSSPKGELDAMRFWSDERWCRLVQDRPGKVGFSLHRRSGAHGYGLRYLLRYAPSCTYALEEEERASSAPSCALLRSASSCSAAQCLGELYRLFGRRITSGLLETTIIAAKLMKFHEEFVRQEALQMLQNALEGSGGAAFSAAYTEAFRLITRIAVGDKSFIIRIAAARCLKTFASIGGPGLGIAELDNSASYCVKALEDPVPSVRDAFAEALGALLALGMNPEAQVQPRGKSHSSPARKLEGGLQRHLTLPFMKAGGARSKDLRMGVTLSWVFFLQSDYVLVNFEVVVVGNALGLASILSYACYQILLHYRYDAITITHEVAIRLKYLHPDSELHNYALQAMDMLRGDSSVDAHALACVLYILRVGVTDQMTEPTQRSFLVLLGKQLESPDISPSMEVAALRTLAYTLKTLGEVPLEFKEVLDNTIVAALSHSSLFVRIEAALTLRTLGEVDPTCVGGLISYGVTTLNALRDCVSFEKGNNLKVDLDSLHGQATVLAALVSVSPNLPLGYPARLPKSVLEVSKKMLTESSRNPLTATVEKEAAWLLLGSLISSMPKEELEDQIFDILSLWAALFSGNPEHRIKQVEDLKSEICVWSAAVDALTAFIRCFVSPTIFLANNGILLQPVLVYLSRALSYISLLAARQLPSMKSAMDLFIIRTLMAYQSLSDPMAFKSDHPQIIQICTTPFRDASGCEESSCLRLLLDKRDAWLGPWIPGRDWFEDELRAFQGGKDGLMPCVWEKELSSFPQPETISKMLVNQMLLCFGIIFASQDSGVMLSLLGMIEQCLKAGKKQSWHAASVTNACVGLLAGLKALLALRPQPLGVEILSSAQAIFQGILAEGDSCASQRRASSEGLGLLARLGNDIFTARMTRTLLGDLIGATDLSYAGSIALALGCIHRSVGGMALSTLVPATVSSISSLAKSSNAGLQIWSLHGLLLTVEAAGLSYVSHVQAILGLAMDIVLSEENGWVDLRQGIGRLINAIVAVLGPELAPGSIFFSRCKSVVAEISSGQETSTLLESVRFTQQLVLFAPQAVSVHSHLQTLLPTLSSRQPTLRHLAVSTLRHLIEKDPVRNYLPYHPFASFNVLDSDGVPLAWIRAIRPPFLSLERGPSSPLHAIFIKHLNRSRYQGLNLQGMRSAPIILRIISSSGNKQRNIVVLDLDGKASSVDLCPRFLNSIAAEKGPSLSLEIEVSIIDEQIEDKLFHMLDEETDSEIGNLVRATITRLLYTSCPSCPSHWIAICRNLVLATSTGRNAGNNIRSEHDSLNGPDGDARLYYGEDDENMFESSLDRKMQGSTFDASSFGPERNKHLRYRTRVFAAECLSHLPAAVGKDSTHFDLSLARRQSANGQASGDWLVLHIQELISLAYQISTIQFENMQPIGVGLLSTIMDKFEKIPDPELPGHFLLEQYQAQLVSAVRTALDTSSGPLLLEAGLLLATKILTSGITSGDQVAVKRIFSLISRPLNDFKDLYYPSFAEWVACKIKIRLLAAHASVKCYTYAFLRRQHTGVPDEYLALIPLFSKSSSILGKYWIWILKDYSYICFCLQLKRDSKPFLDGIQSPLVSSKLQPCLEEAWPVILQALALDSVPVTFDVNVSSETTVEDITRSNLISGCSMVELELREFQFLWGFALLVLFQGQHPIMGKQIIPLDSAKVKSSGDSPVEETNHLGLKLYEIVLPVFQFLSTERFFSMGFLTIGICIELLQVFSYSIHMEDSWNSLVIPVLLQIVQNCPEDFFETEGFAYVAMELCATYLYKIFQSTDKISQDHPLREDLISALFIIAETLTRRFEPKKQLKAILAFLLTGFKCLRGASTESSFLKVNNFVQHTGSLLKKHGGDKAKLGEDGVAHLKTVLGACQNLIASLIKDCIKGIHLLENKRSNACKLLQMKLSFSLGQTFSLAKLAQEIEQLGENKDINHIFFPLYNHCIKCIGTALTDSDIQVQTIGLQVLKSMAQRNGEDNSFFMFFIGELYRDIFIVIQKMMKKPVTREAVAITSEWLRLLVLLQTLSKASECQKGLMNLLLETIVMVVSASDDDHSQELIEIRNTAVRLVSHLAQIPSSAIQFKDVLLAMPVARRQQLQGIIRASVSQDQSATQMKSTVSPLIIKLPVQRERSTEKDSQVYASASATTNSDKDSMEEEEDWDAFQSFPAASDAPTANSRVDSAAEEPASVENSSILDCSFSTNKDSHEYSSSQPLKDVKEISDAAHLEAGEGEVILASQSERTEFEELNSPQPINCVTEPCSDHHQEGEEDAVTTENNNRPVLSGLPNFEDAEGMSEEYFVEKSEQSSKVSQGDGKVLSDLPPLEYAQESHVELQMVDGGRETDGRPSLHERA
ncbi:hypothetical protein HHK36_015012 [Tetracentron sinense]|uniref:HEAT repeat-containing protein 5B n=1 Tax=Tetracentron sinense TaxID=13715 RepID=A0A834Z3X3_TETSI|nr:hypothetical protein HHK36_015012 [Tetracentron sinense]